MTITKPEYINLFPTPVICTSLDRDFSKEETDFFYKQLESVNCNEGNVTSTNSYILEEPEMKSLKIIIQEALNLYMSTIIVPKNKLNVKITQSWLNLTEENHYHHKHSHSNSIISGVLYIDTCDETDKITFHNPKSWWSEQIAIPTNDYNEWNSPSWWIPAETKSILMFPSQLQHSVKTITTKKRISLAFNTWVDGELGDHFTLTQLKM